MDQEKENQINSRFFRSKKEQYKQYRRYLKEYKRLAQDYGNNMTSPFDYDTYKEERKQMIKDARRLGVNTPTNRAMATSQVRTSYLAARTRVKNAKTNIKNIMEKEKRGEQLTEVESRILDLATDEVPYSSRPGETRTKRVMKDINWKEFRNDTGVLVDLNNKLKVSGMDYEEQVFGSK